MKIPLVAALADQEVRGREETDLRRREIATREMEERAKRKSVQTEEKPRSKAVDPDDRRRGEQKKKKQEQKGLKKSRDVAEDTTTEEYVGHGLRKRREEDDAGKGDQLDIRG